MEIPIFALSILDNGNAFIQVDPIYKDLDILEEVSAIIMEHNKIMIDIAEKTRVLLISMKGAKK